MGVVCGSSHAPDEPTVFQTDRYVAARDAEETKPPVLNENSSMNGIVLPTAQLRHDSLSDLITPDKMFHSVGMGVSPLKVRIFLAFKKKQSVVVILRAAGKCLRSDK